MVKKRNSYNGVQFTEEKEEVVENKESVTTQKTQFVSAVQPKRKN